MSDQHEDERTVDRRRLLRRAGGVAAGIAGAGVAVAASGGPAQAAPGGNVILGQANDGGTQTTSVTSSGAQATVSLANTSRVADGGYTLAGPSLRLVPAGDGIAPSAVGSISMDSEGYIWAITGEYNGTPLANYVHTTANSNRIVPIVPQRAVDTRYSSNRGRIINPSGNLDSSGRVIGGKTIHLDLSDYVFVGDAVMGNATVTGEVKAGYLAVWPYGVKRPANFSTVNFQAKQDLSNSFLSGLGFNLDAISIYAHVTTHVIIDVFAFVVGVGAVNPAYLVQPTATAMGTQSVEDPQAQRMERARTKQPKWQR